MTYEEAINRIKEGKPFSEIYNAEWEEAKQKAIEALEKQIPQKPKKPILEKDKEHPIIFRYSCPSCGAILFVKYYNEKEHHCKCGQAIDWGE